MPRQSLRILSLYALLVVASAAGAQETLRLGKIDPPNWYASLPKPMLLVRGEALAGAKFTISDPALKIERIQTSENGHWAQLWLSASPAKPETVQIRAVHGAAHAEAAYTFAARRGAESGMAGFSPADVMYLIVTDRFADGDAANDGPLAQDAATSAAAAAERAKARGWHGGDLRGIADHIPYLEALGVTTVWTTPVYQNHAAEAFHGYHTTDYYAVDEHYGTLADLQALVRALHARHMKLVLDTVPNHVGPMHPWVTDEPAPDWFHGTAAHHIAGQTDFHALIDPHASAQSRVATLQGWFVDQLPDMNTDSLAVAVYLRQNAVWWIEQTGADGLRIDTFPYVDRPFWNAFNGELKALYPKLTEVGEVSDGDPEVTSAFADGVTRAGVDTRLYTPFDFPFYHAARDIFAGTAPFTRMERVLVSDELYPHPERLVPFLGNHDESRLAQDVPDPALRQVAYALLLTTRGMPQLYAGDELGQRGGNDPYNRADFPGGFASDSANAFEAKGRSADQQRDFAGIQNLLAIRKAHPALLGGEEQILQAGIDTFVYVRMPLAGGTGTPVLVALNKGKAVQTLTLSTEDTALAGMIHARTLLGASDSAMLGLHTLTLKLAPVSAVIAELE